jgi:hypothetical protein
MQPVFCQAGYHSRSGSQIHRIRPSQSAVPLDPCWTPTAIRIKWELDSLPLYNRYRLKKEVQRPGTDINALEKSGLPVDVPIISGLSTLGELLGKPTSVLGGVDVRKRQLQGCYGCNGW